MYTSEAKGNVAVLDSHYLVGTPKAIQHFTERYEVGLFTRQQYLEAFHKARLEVHYESKGLMGEECTLESRSKNETECEAAKQHDKAQMYPTRFACRMETCPRGNQTCVCSHMGKLPCNAPNHRLQNLPLLL